MSIIPLQTVQLWWKPLRFPYTFETLAEGTAFLQQRARKVWPDTIQECTFTVTWQGEEPVEGTITVDEKDSGNPQLLEHAVQGLLENEALLFASSSRQPMEYQRIVATVGWQMEAVISTRTHRALRLLTCGEGLCHEAFRKNFARLQQGIRTVQEEYPLLKGCGNQLRPSYHAVRTMANRTEHFRSGVLSALDGRISAIFEAALAGDAAHYRQNLDTYRHETKAILGEGSILDERRTKKGQELYRLGKEDLIYLASLPDAPLPEEDADEFFHRDTQILGLFRYPLPSEGGNPSVLYQSLYASAFYGDNAAPSSRLDATRHVARALREEHHLGMPQIRNLVRLCDPMCIRDTGYLDVASSC